MNAIEAEGLGHAFGKRWVLEDVSFTVPEGCLAVLTGPNGAGKSTLIALLANLYGVRRGHVRLLGHALPRQAPRALAETGLVFQRPSLDLDLTVAENLACHAALHGMAPAKAAARAAEEMARQGLADRLHARARELSVGQRRRVEIGRALMQRPRLLLLDEPAASLDADGRALLRAGISALRRECGTAILWATHSMADVAEAEMEIRLGGGRLA